MARRVFIPKPGSDERRPLSIPSVRDRVVQAAVKIVLEPVFEADMLACSFGFRPRHATHDALRVLIDESFRGDRWVVDHAHSRTRHGEQPTGAARLGAVSARFRGCCLSGHSYRIATDSIAGAAATESEADDRSATQAIANIAPAPTSIAGPVKPAARAARPN